MTNSQNKKEKFLELIQEHRKIIFKICNSYCKSKSDREDIGQEIIYQLWKSFDSYNPDFKFTTWMYRVALNVAISFYRKDKRHQDTISIDEHLIEISAEEDHSNDQNNNFILLQQFINELKELDKALMILYLEDKSYKEIAEILGITETNVATKISRIKEKIKYKFKNIQN